MSRCALAADFCFRGFLGRLHAQFVDAAARKFTRGLLVRRVELRDTLRVGRHLVFASRVRIHVVRNRERCGSEADQQLDLIALG